MSGFWRTAPPVEEKLPGVMAVPSAWKKTRRVPSELKVSTGFAAPPMKAVSDPAVATLTAATLKELVAAECPRVLPAVLMLNRGAGQYEFRQRVSILLQADGVYELADMRAACEQALTFRRMVDASARTRRCVGVRCVYARGGLGASVRLRTAGGEGVPLPVQDGPAFGDEGNAQFKVVNYRFGEAGDGGQLVTPHAPLAIAPLTE